MVGSLFKNKAVIFIVLFALSLGALYFTLSDLGVTIDEPYKNRTAAKLFVEWLELTLQDISQGNWSHVFSQEVIESFFHPPYIYHPPFARLLTGVTWKLFHPYVGELKALRLAPAILFSLNVALLFILIAKYFNISSGFVASLALLFIPSAFGHAHLIALDSPIASMWFFTVFCFIKGLESRRWSIILGIVWGLALNTKIHAYFIPVPLFIWSFLYCRNRFQNNFFAMLFLSPIILFISNPYLWHDTIYNWFSFLSVFVKRKEFSSVAVYFLGTTYSYSAPWYYPFFMVFITLPPTILVLSLLGTTSVFFRGMWSSLASLPWQASVGTLFLLNAIAPLGLAAIHSAPNYDGVRLFLPAYPFLAGLAGIGFYYLQNFIRWLFRGKIIRADVLVLGIIFLAPPLYSLIRIHPYELSYFNIFIGGIRGAREAGLETTYWNDPFNPAFVRILNSRFAGKSFRPVMANKNNFNYYHELGLLRTDITYRDDDYDYLLLGFRQGWFEDESWFYAKYIDPVYSEEIDGVPLLGIYQPLDRIAQETVRPENKTLPDQEELPPQLTVMTSDSSHPGQWSCLFKAPEGGAYWFGVLTKEEVEILIDDKKHIQAEASLKGSFKEKEVALEKGFHIVTVRFQQVYRPTLFYLGWRTSAQRLGLMQCTGPK